ncbi:hypothetical protein [Emticicia agri]|uniref:Galactose oxidase n=1 Tax=Emticicia agri TaxID=2492393 RepID=A0A4Q5LYD1_9BACT|nr:hypothetical protein [Emticicia agri]RYU94655.1 hypothetical protein EWM59_16115 [Emticicia agri]
MKSVYKIVLASSLITGIFACEKKNPEFIDETLTREEAPTYTADSPMWRKLNSPQTYSFTDGVVKTEMEDLYSCVMVRPDTTNDHLAIDNKSRIEMAGNIDAQTTITGTYSFEGNFWNLRKLEATPRYAPMLLGPFAVFGRTEVEYFSLLGGGYAINENFPNGINYYLDNWMQTDFNLSGDIVGATILTGFMANNDGYFIENNAGKQMWHISRIRVYEKLKPFPGAFLGKFAMASAKLNRKEYGYVLLESESANRKTNEFYQYDAANDAWIRKADFPGEDRYEGVIFGIADKIYYGLGQSKTEAKGFRDIWEYDLSTDTWVRFATYPGSGNIKVSTAKVSGKVYIGFGYYVGATKINTEKYIGVSDFWEFVPSRK